MSFLENVMKRISSATTSTVTCPLCGHRSSHAASKIRKNQTLLCPACKSLFVVNNQ
ncbi:YnfU family zinc-binding protein [Erwinia sorbitola]|uniref:YnfU family zinc-binding protein n=1 Tax=Erwinia sorbitola TaxID=2681984 RepID=UPI00210356D3|nr:YnfU family zinc-binding protein [Erwinia sorbitola]